MTADTTRESRRDRWLVAVIVTVTTVLVGYNLVMFYASSYFLKGRQVAQLTLTDPHSGAEHPVPVPEGTVLLNFWATWCSSCVAELPVLAEYAPRVTVIGLLKAPVRPDRLQEMALPWKNYIAPDALFDDFMVAGVPVTMLVRDRAIVAVHTGPVTREVLDQWLTQKP